MRERLGRTRRGAAAGAALAAALAAAGCSGGDGPLPPVRFGFLTGSEDVRPPAPPRPAPEMRAVARVDRVELGRLHRGRLLSAFGEAAAPGWRQATLAPRAEGRPGPDGFVEFDMIAAAPDPEAAAAGAGPGAPAQRALRAERILPEAMLQGAVGVRVFAASGPPVALRFDGA